MVQREYSEYNVSATSITIRRETRVEQFLFSELHNTGKGLYKTHIYVWSRQNTLKLEAVFEALCAHLVRSITNLNSFPLSRCFPHFHCCGHPDAIPSWAPVHYCTTYKSLKWTIQNKELQNRVVLGSLCCNSSQKCKFCVTHDGREGSVCLLCMPVEVIWDTQLTWITTFTWHHNCIVR